MRKAIIGAGYSTGVAEDLSRAAGWLCTKGINGAAILHNVLKKATNKPSVSLNADGHYVFKDISILACGTSIIDILVSEIKGSANEHSESQVDLVSIDVPLLLVALAAKAAKEFDVSIKMLFLSGETIVISPSTIDFKDYELQSGVDAVLKCSSFKSVNTSKSKYTNGENEENIEMERKSISIPESTIQLLNTFAAKTYVPATEASRLAGAGAGLNDND